MCALCAKTIRRIVFAVRKLLGEWLSPMVVHSLLGLSSTGRGIFGEVDIMEFLISFQNY